MPVLVQSEAWSAWPWPIDTESIVTKLWNSTREYAVVAVDDMVTVRCVSIEQMTQYNREHRGKDKPTNVLTFSYAVDSFGKGMISGIADMSTEHDIVLCGEVALTESQAVGMPLADYTALLLVHAFLHAVGWDHEASTEAADQTRQAEMAILSANGFTQVALGDLEL